MKRTLFLVAALVAFATAASAATLSVVSDKASYNVGETITLTISGSDAGATTYGIFGQLLYSDALVGAGASRTQISMGAGGWTKQALDAGPGFSNAFAQIVNPAAAASALSDVSETAFSTVLLVAKAVGVANVTWNTAAGSGFELGFFGLTSAPGVSFSIVPEPTTMALLGLGLVGIAVAGRRRQ